MPKLLPSGDGEKRTSSLKTRDAYSDAGVNKNIPDISGRRPEPKLA